MTSESSVGPRLATQFCGLHFNSLVPLDLDNVDKLSSAFDSKVKVRVALARAAQPDPSASGLRRAASLLLPQGWLS